MSIACVSRARDAAEARLPPVFLQRALLAQVRLEVLGVADEPPVDEHLRHRRRTGDRADGERRIECPVHALWGERGVVHKLYAPVADWQTKRRWVQYAFTELEQAGYTVASAYTAVKNPQTTKFVYRDRLWQGADLVVTRYLLGVRGLLKRLSGEIWQRHAAAIGPVYAARWDQVDISDPKHPRLTCPVSELQRVP